MAGKTDQHSDSVLNVLRNVTLTGLATVYVGLFTTSPTDDGQSSGVESSYGTDTRKAVTLTAPEAGVGRKIENDPAVSWTGWNGGTQTFLSLGIFDAATAGNRLMHGTLTTSRTINDGETGTFAIDSISIDED